MQVQNQTALDSQHNQHLAESQHQEQAIQQLVAERHEDTVRMLEADSDCV